MKYRIYLRAEGLLAELEDFQAQVILFVQGSILRRKHNGAPLNTVSMQYWKSEDQVVSSSSVEYDLLKLLRKIPNDLVLKFAGQKLSFTAAIVCEVSPNEESSGYFLSSDLISALNFFKAQLDIDVLTKYCA